MVRVADLPWFLQHSGPETPPLSPDVAGGFNPANDLDPLAGPSGVMQQNYTVIGRPSRSKLPRIGDLPPTFHH